MYLCTNLIPLFMRKKILFIINPVSGIGRYKSIREVIHKEMDTQKWSIEIVNTTSRNHAFKLSKQGAGHYDIIVAVGGDGTVNEVGRGLMHSSSIMGILPTGSGNGLARFLQIPFKINKAIQVLNESIIKPIDVIKLNEHFSLNVAGIGFDAFISHKFASRKKRGPLAYMHLITKEFARYKALSYKVSIDNKTQDWDAFLISFANSNQYGNNFYIAPKARIDDGLIDVCLIRDFPKVEAPALLISLLDQSIDRNKYDVIVKASTITVEHTSNMLGHVDGEPVMLGKKAEISILPLALKIAAPPSHLKQSQNLLSPLIEMLPSITRN